jgi:hypothetical protein
MAKFKPNEKVYVLTGRRIEVGRVQIHTKFMQISMRNYVAWFHQAKCFKTREAAEAALKRYNLREAKSLRARAVRDFKTYVLPSLREAAKLDPAGATPEWFRSLKNYAPYARQAIDFCKKHLGIK